jgi:hypothetical protein
MPLLELALVLELLVVVELLVVELVVELLVELVLLTLLETEAVVLVVELLDEPPVPEPPVPVELVLLPHPTSWPANSAPTTDVHPRINFKLIRPPSTP